MESSSSDRNRKPRSKSSGNRNKSGGNRNRRGGRRRRPEPKPTGFQKFIKAITFGLVDPTKKKRKKGKSSGRKTDRRRIIEEPTTPRLYIGNLSYDLSDEELKAAFSPVGKVVSAAVVRHGDSGRSKGFGFVEMGSLEEAKAAVSKLNDTDLKGRQLLVSGAKAEKPRNRDGQGSREGRERREGGGRERRNRDGGERSSRSEGRSSDGRSRERKGGRSRSDDRIEKPTRQVQPLKIEQVSGPRLLVSNLNKEATDVDIADLFDGIGEIAEKSDITVKGDAPVGELTVEFTETEAAQKAVEVIDMKFFMGHQLSLKGIEGGEPKSVEIDEASTEEAPSEEPAGEETS